MGESDAKTILKTAYPSLVEGVVCEATNLYVVLGQIEWTSAKRKLMGYMTVTELYRAYQDLETAQ